jgi:hypothetical protein
MPNTLNSPKLELSAHPKSHLVHSLLLLQVTLIGASIRPQKNTQGLLFTEKQFADELVSGKVSIKTMV